VLHQVGVSLELGWLVSYGDNIKIEPKEIACEGVIFLPVLNINTVDPLKALVLITPQNV
jgi:hypothetical protein